MAQLNHEATWFLLEEKQIFSQSILWRLQEEYFQQRGVKAWLRGEVPHYITCNPVIANCYAEMVLAIRRDQLHIYQETQPLIICELGAGSGRFAFHFLHRLAQLCEYSKIPLSSFCYIATDIVQTNLNFWLQHPRFQSFLEMGVFDVALFDITQSTELCLQYSSRKVTPSSLSQPLVVIANYVFDTIPQELIYFNQQQSYQGLISLYTEQDPRSLDIAELIGNLHYQLDYQEGKFSLYDDHLFQTIIRQYQSLLSDCYVLFPAPGLLGLQRLKCLSREGLILLTSDKGDHHLVTTNSDQPSILVGHGSFSIKVNYHAFKIFCELNAGLALFSDHPVESINTGCLLMLKNAMEWTETQCAFQKNINEFGPDDFYTIVKHVKQNLTGLTLSDIKSCLRLAYYDSYLAGFLIPRLSELMPSDHEESGSCMVEIVDKIWDNYFPIAEDYNLPSQIAQFLYVIDDYPNAIKYFQHSIEIYGKDTGTLYNMAVCYHLLGKSKEARFLLDEVLQHDPDNQSASNLLAMIPE